MRRHHEESIGKVLSRLTKENGWDDKLIEARILSSWHELFGPHISKHTLSVRIKDGLLVVSVSVAAMRQELWYAREQMRTRINEHLGFEYVQSLEIR
ncbi:MAG: DUF721 domain-containing protein [Bacteroidota bacterium]|jgi:predicted nucleic acid-binding Zn ribbon protein